MGVSVVTPSLNKSFKFQSDWPYNNSQVYLLTPLLEDITNDENRTFEKTEDGYQITVSANYPNNSKLVKQSIILDKNINIKKVIVMDSNENPQITMKFSKIDLNSKFKDNYFDLKEIIDIKDENTEENIKDENGEIQDDVIEYGQYLSDVYSIYKKLNIDTANDVIDCLEKRLCSVSVIKPKEKKKL